MNTLTVYANKLAVFILRVFKTVIGWSLCDGKVTESLVINSQHKQR